LENIAPMVEKSIHDGQYPGAVILVSHRGKLIYKGIFGNRSIVPKVMPMQFNTIFDLASLTKVIATTPAIMQLVEAGKIDLDARVTHYWPNFGEHGKSAITIRELLTHTSGLPAELPTESSHLSHAELFNQIEQLKPAKEPGTAFHYSDVNFLILGILVEKVSGLSLDQYARQNIYAPLGMRNTFFNPAQNLRDRIAPTEMTAAGLRWGSVQDPTAASLGGVAGNAGLFATAGDLGVFAQSLLNGGKLSTPYWNKNYWQTHFLGPISVAKMTSSQTPSSITDVRGLGWDMDSAYSNRGVLFSTKAYGHTGWTGTSILIDPASQTWIVVLTSRSHPSLTKHNQVMEDRRIIANIVAASVVDVMAYGYNNTGHGEISRAYQQKNAG
jgi:CubicO group peptidase (beta-lactamase class C family)